MGNFQSKINSIPLQVIDKTYVVVKCYGEAAQVRELPLGYSAFTDKTAFFELLKKFANSTVEYVILMTYEKNHNYVQKFKYVEGQEPNTWELQDSGEDCEQILNEIKHSSNNQISSDIFGKNLVKIHEEFKRIFAQILSESTEIDISEFDITTDADDRRMFYNFMDVYGDAFDKGIIDSDDEYVTESALNYMNRSEWFDGYLSKEKYSSNVYIQIPYPFKKFIPSSLTKLFK